MQDLSDGYIWLIYWCNICQRIKCFGNLPYLKLELVYLPVGKYCVYPRMVYRQAMAKIEYDLLSMCFMQHLIRCCIRRYIWKILSACMWLSDFMW